MLKLERKNKSGTALEILQEAILSGNIKGDTEITQNDVAISLGVSRMPVREAITALEYCGLVERLPNQHVKVVKLDYESIESIFQDMVLIETDIIKNLNIYEINALSLSSGQFEFHKTLYESVSYPLRKKFLKSIIEVYLNFVLRNSENLEVINYAFMNLLRAVKNTDTLRNAYVEYCEILTAEFMKIRKNGKAD